MKKKTIVILTSIVFVCIVSIVFISGILQYSTGVITNITAKAGNGDSLELRMDYFFSLGGYSVRTVADDEGEYCGDGMKDYDGSLGKYRVIVEFGDVEPHESFTNRENIDGVFEIHNPAMPLKGKIAHPSDHGFVLYIGSDKPIFVENSSGNDLEGLWGAVKIPILVGDSDKPL